MLSRLFAMVVLLVLVGGGFYYWRLEQRGLPPPESLGEISSQLGDAKTTGSVKGALALNRRLRPHDIAVATEEGVVVLRGRVPSEPVRQLAEEVAGAVPGVRQVVNHLRVSESAASEAEDAGRSLGESLDDHKVEVEVRLAFSLRRELQGSDIDVSAFRREVTLSGEVDSDDQRALAARVASEVPGVTGVADRLRLRGGRSEPSDAADLEAVRRALASSGNLDASAIRVERDGGRLVLAGRVRSGAEKELAEVLARGAAGGEVESRLEVVP